MKFGKVNTQITLFIAASIAAAAAVPKLSESKDASSTDDYDEQQLYLKTKGCPSYGCPMLPRDLFFDEEAQQALKAIREFKSTSAANTSGTESKSSSTDQGDQVESQLDTTAALELLKNVGGSDGATLTLIGYKGGQLTEQINQDRAFVISPYYIKTNKEQVKRLLGVFDGHAKLGELVSEYSVVTLPQLLSKKLEIILDQAASDSSSSDDGESFEKNEAEHPKKEIQQALVESFIELDKEAPAEKSGGCTASVVLQLGRWVYVANAGDSRSLIATYNKKTSEVKIEYITREDKPDLPEERKRVESMGGQVYVPTPEKLQMGASSRVLYVDKETGGTNGLAMSRSIGDWAAGEKGVIPDPTVDVLDITKLTKGQCESRASVGASSGETKIDNSCDEGNIEVFAVSATDGLLDFMDVDNIAKTVAQSLYEDESPHPLSACESLITTAASAWWSAKNGRYRDDIA
eukprot:CAMPEP_0194114740 /NCGR_PEP_ID=MMETSP0150-20130528/21472_1 /TAXON_ID=122233 /ORGANISM="Chaetoceros debilis, Strain MM31A-1" /LENGTH=462 /DNA_ID=CAMNT_0038805043 /DNA_START=101 /DNA_END=1485 /DNA_ORIENTATION=-